MGLLLLVTVVLLLSVHNTPFLQNVGGTSTHFDEVGFFHVHVRSFPGGADGNVFEDTIHVDVVGYTNLLNTIDEKHDSIAQPPLFAQTQNANGIDSLGLVFECRNDKRGVYYYEKSRVEQILPSFPKEPCDFQPRDDQLNKQKNKRPLYPHYFRNDDDLKWPLNKIACDNAKESRLEMPMGRGPTFHWDWESYLNFLWPLPYMSKVGYNLFKPDPWLVRIIYVYEVAGNNLLCGVVIHRTKDSSSKFELCPMIEDPRNIN